MDLVTCKWICEIVCAEETSTQIQAAFCDALQLEGLDELAAAHQDSLAAPLLDDAVRRPILLAVSDNGPQMTSGSTRESRMRISARKGLVVVRSGKGDAYREVELNALVRAMLDEWVAERAKIAGEGETSFFVSRAGSALSSRSIDLAVRRVADRARLELSAHVLRHTFVSGLVRAGNDVVLVAELAGHRRLETTRRYSLASKADRQKAVADLEIEF
jgi:hypothetical protein